MDTILINEKSSVHFYSVTTPRDTEEGAKHIIWLKINLLFILKFPVELYCIICTNILDSSPFTPMLSSWVPSKSQTEKCCEAELSRVASLLEIMSECLNASLVEMAAKKEHVYAHIRFKYCRVLRESRALRSHQNQFCQGLALPSIFHPLPTLSAFLFSSSVPSHLYPPAFSPIYDSTLTFNPSVTILFSSYITSPFLVSTLH